MLGVIKYILCDFTERGLLEISACCPLDFTPCAFLLCCFCSVSVTEQRTLWAFLEQTPHNMSSACLLSVEKNVASEAFLEFQRSTLPMVFNLSLEKDMVFCLNVLSLSFFFFSVFKFLHIRCNFNAKP